MAQKFHTTKEQVAIDKKTKEVADKKRNKNLMYIGGAVLVVGVAIYLLRKTYPKTEIIKDRISFLYISLLVGSIWIIKVLHGAH